MSETLNPISSLIAPASPPRPKLAPENAAPLYCLGLLQALGAQTPNAATQLQTGKSLRQSIADLRPEERDRLQKSVGEASLAEILSLATNSDLGSLWEDAFHLGIRLKQGGQPEKAAGLFQFLSQDFVAEPIRAKSAQELDAMQGKGSAGLRAEFLLSRFAREATDYRTIVPMAFGTAVSSLLRSATLARFAGLSEELWFTRGLPARFAASGLAFSAEVPAFTLAARALRSDSSSLGLGRDLASSALSLGLFKFTGALGESAASALPGTWHHALLTQASTFGGLLLSRGLEEQLGLRPKLEGSTTLVDALSSLLTLNAGARLGHQLLGGKFSQLQAETELRISRPKNAPFPALDKDPFFPIFAMANHGDFGDGKGRGPETNLSTGSVSLAAPPSTRSFTLENLADLKQELLAAKGDSERLPAVITRLMQVAFSPDTTREVRNAAGKTLFAEGHFQAWQEHLLDQGKPEIDRLRGLSREALIDAADKCLTAMEQMTARGDDLAVARLLGPLVYMAYRTLHEPSQNKLAEFLLAHPRPFVRVGALIHQYPDLHVPWLRIMQWDQYERVLTLGDLLSENPSRHAVAKGLLKNLQKAEQASGTQYPVIQGIVEALGNPIRLANLYAEIVPEHSIKAEGVEAQIKSLLALPLVISQKEMSAKILQEMAEEAYLKVRAMPFNELRLLFSKEGLSPYPHGIPMKLFPEIVSRKIRSLVAEKRLGQAEVPGLVASYQQLFKFLDRNLQVARGTEPGYLHFVDPFTN